jgi:hypothetical protein
MVFEKLLGWLGELFGQTDRFTFVRYEIRFERTLGQMALQLFAEYYAKLLIQSNQSNVESGVVKRREAQAIARTQTLFIGAFAPWLDVARNQQIGNGNTGNATANAVSIEDCLTKELLAAADSDNRLPLCRPGWNREFPRRFQPNLIAFKEIQFTVIVLRKQVVKQLLALKAEPGKTILKLIPHQLILLGSTFESFNTSRFLYRVKGCKITQLHREAIRSAPHLLSNFDNYGIEAVKFSERQLAVEIEGDQQMLSRPFHTGSLGHTGIMAEQGAEMKPEQSEPGRQLIRLDVLQFSQLTSKRVNHWEQEPAK